MKVKMLKDYDHRLKPAVIQCFRAGREYSVPKSTGNAMIKAGAAELITQQAKED